MAFLHKEDDHNDTDKRKEYGAEDRYSSEPQKVHLTGEFIIVEKFSGHVLRHLASRLANVIRQADEKPSFSDLQKQICTSIIVALVYALHLGLVTPQQFNKGTFSRLICL